MASTYEKIATNTLGSTTTTVTFSSIAGTYTDLVLVIAGTSIGADYTITLRFNSDTGSNYSATFLQGNGTAASSTRDTTQTSMNAGSITTVQSNSIISIQNYSNTTTYKTVFGRANASGARMRNYAGLWRNTAAINSVAVTTNGTDFATGCTFTLYGILKAA
jgi:hypothetical protein